MLRYWMFFSFTEPAASEHVEQAGNVCQLSVNIISWRQDCDQQHQ